MKYYYILIVSIILIYQLYRTFRTAALKKDAGLLLNAYKHKSPINGIYFAALLQIYLIYDDIMKRDLTVLLWLLPTFLFLLVAYSKSSKQIELYEKGIIVFGDFLHWYRIKSVLLEKKDIQIITDEKDSKYYTISDIKNRNLFYNELMEHIPQLADQYTPIEESDDTIDLFMKDTLVVGAYNEEN